MIIKKVTLLGNPGVGKTSLINRFVHNMFSEKYISTIGTRVSRKDVKVSGRDMTLMIWDLLGDRDFRILQTSALKGSAGALLVCDITNEESIRDLDYWEKTLGEAVGDIPMLVLVNKIDLVDRGNLKFDYHIPFMFTSAKTGENVEAAFLKIAEMMMEAME